MVQLFRGRWGKRLLALLLRSTVEGQEAEASLSMERGTPHFSARPIPKNVDPDMAILAQFLRSREPISADIRHWLAELCDPDGESRMKLTVKRRRSGRPQASMLEHLAAVERFMDYKAEGNFEYAVARTKEEFGLERTALMKAWHVLRPAIEETRRLNREGQ